VKALAGMEGTVGEASPSTLVNSLSIPQPAAMRLLHWRKRWGGHLPDHPVTKFQSRGGAGGVSTC